MTEETRKAHRYRVVVVAGLFFAWLMVIGGRAGYLQIRQGAWLSQKAAGQYEQELTIPGKRGTIYDAHHQAMAVSIETSSVAAYPALVENKPAAAAALAKALHLNKRQVEKKLGSDRSFVWLKRQATPKETEAVKKAGLKGIDFLPEHSRFYPNTTLASHVLGFTGIDGHGLEGLEFSYDHELNGREQTLVVRKDALGRGFDLDSDKALNRVGNNLVLTIDRQIQFITEQALAEAVIGHKAKSGMAIVMAPQTGAILAMAHYPLFNPNNFRKYDRSAWRNRAITDPFEPGSTMKIFSAAAALESGTSEPSTIYYCENGSYLLGGHTVNDTKPHGWLSLQQIIKYSSNIGAVKVAEKIGKRTLYSYLTGFGFGDRTDFACPGESPASLSSYKRWTVVDTGAISFGQGISVTALQLVTAASAIANDGVLMKPNIVLAVTDPHGRPLRTVEPQVVRRVVSAQTARVMRRIMGTVITEGGTGVQAGLDGYSVCGKTGTAQKVGKDGTYSKDRYLASFIGFAPADHPAITVLVVVDEPPGNYYASYVAAPAFRQIVKETLGYLNIVPSDSLKNLRVSREIRSNG